MKRVSTANQCPVCSKSSWCLYDEFQVLCMRVESKKPYTLKSGEIGWWHDLKDKPREWKPPQRIPEPAKVDGSPLMKRWLEGTPPGLIRNHAEQLGVRPSALLQLKVAWSSEHHAYAWPMRDSDGKIQGIRLRTSEGRKWSVTGAGSGIFMPWCEPRNMVYIVEGGTDVAAMLSMNIYAWGRPSCSGGIAEINANIMRLKIQRAVIIADSDRDREIGGRLFNPGEDGAERLSEMLPIPHCVTVLPCKDAREFLNNGGTQEILECLVKSAIWRKV